MRHFRSCREPCLFSKYNAWHLSALSKTITNTCRVFLVAQFLWGLLLCYPLCPLLESLFSFILLHPQNKTETKIKMNAFYKLIMLSLWKLKTYAIRRHLKMLFSSSNKYTEYFLVMTYSTSLPCPHGNNTTLIPNICCGAKLKTTHIHGHTNHKMKCYHSLKTFWNTRNLILWLNIKTLKFDANNPPLYEGNLLMLFIWHAVVHKK